MKRNIITLLFILIISYINAASLDYVVKTYNDGYKVNMIRPTIDNFIKLSNMNYQEFADTFEKYGYINCDFGEYMAYWNGNIDNLAEYVCVYNTFIYGMNTFNHEIGYIASYDKVYPSTDITDLQIALNPYKQKSYKIDSGATTTLYVVARGNDKYYFFITSSGFWDIRIVKNYFFLDN